MRASCGLGILMVLGVIASQSSAKSLFEELFLNDISTVGTNAGGTGATAEVTGTIAGVTATNVDVTAVTAEMMRTIDGVTATNMDVTAVTAEVTGTIAAVTATNVDVTAVTDEVTGTIDAVTATKVDVTVVTAEVTGTISGVTATNVDVTAATAEVTGTNAGVTATNGGTTMDVTTVGESAAVTTDGVTGSEAVAVTTVIDSVTTVAATPTTAKPLPVNSILVLLNTTLDMFNETVFATAIDAIFMVQVTTAPVQPDQTTEVVSVQQTTAEAPTSVLALAVELEMVNGNGAAIVKHSIGYQSWFDEHGECEVNVTVVQTRPDNNDQDLAVEFNVVANGLLQTREQLDDQLRNAIAQLEKDLNTAVVVVNFAKEPAQVNQSVVELVGVTNGFNEFGFRQAVANGLNAQTHFLLSTNVPGQYSAYDVYVTSTAGDSKLYTVRFWVATARGIPVSKDSLDTAVELNLVEIANGSGALTANLVRSTPPPPTDEDNGLEPYAIALIVIACAIVLIIIIVVSLKMTKKNKRNREGQMSAPPQRHYQSVPARESSPHDQAYKNPAYEHPKESGAGQSSHL